MLAVSVTDSGGLDPCAQCDKRDDYKVVFMHPRGPSRYFRWPQREDICWVPRVYMLGNVSALSTATGQSSKISAEDSAALDTSFEKV